MTEKEATARWAVRATVIDVAGLKFEVRAEMYALFARYYAATSRDIFERDLSAKDSVFLLRDEAGRLCGFSTLAVWPMVIGGTRLRVLFSGDTIIERAHWGSQAFSFAWIRQIGRIAARDPGAVPYWLLTVKGHRTYRYLPAFGLDFVPDWRRPDDARLTALRHAIAARRFGDAYDPATGILRFAHPQGYLAPQWSVVTPREANRADVRFFLERNPGYRNGDELVCLCELSPANMRPLTRRLYDQGFASWTAGSD